MHKSVFFFCLVGFASIAMGAWVPEAESLDPFNPKCMDIMEELGAGMDTSIDLDPPRNYTPSSWDPLMVNSALSFGSARCGITEQSKLAQSFLCNLNDKRYSLFLPQLKWHYGLAYLAEEVDSCADYGQYPAEQMSPSGCFGMRSCVWFNTKFPGGAPTNQRAYEAVDKWFNNYNYYQYPMSTSTGEPAGYNECPRRNGGGPNQIEKFASLLWSEAEYIGCSRAECTDANGLYWNYNCVVASYSSSYDINDASRPLFSKAVQEQFDLVYGLPVCSVA
ncbi:uncharacterized protein LOC142354255 [Convolutriloba macropyga]|uniref:uncharacterized protein LOC142354255 n=1 Tax=Convolutriloba macropyga TaxID=536237 RepID=UPI003F522C39